IYKKADQIDVLVSDLFSATLEDLDELKVSCTDESSEVIGEIIRKYDDRELVTLNDIPKMLIRVDVKRLSQVIGNIISNSYKYANTKIEVSYKLVDDYLEMRIKDFGPGVPPDELDLITNKFYRGKQWAESKEEGSGLGLYIAKMLMEKMDGELLTASEGEGLTVTLMISLS
ncbi:MAG: ATP-binding protein, partial [Lachnospiraceae bacterium]|nr:ATP-binding protein [Lachnospiraceae bacterium]